MLLNKLIGEPWVLVISLILRPFQCQCQSETKQLRRNPKNDALLSLYTKKLSHPAHLNIIPVLKMSHLTFILHKEQLLRSAVQMWCMSCMVKEDVVDTRTDTDQILFSRSRDTRSCSELQWRGWLSSWGIHLSICSGIYPDAEKKPQKMPVQKSQKITLNDNFPRKQESLRLISVNITTISGAATHARTHTDARTLAVWAFVCFWVYIKCVKGNISACLQFASTYVNESTRVNVPMLRR